MARGPQARWVPLFCCCRIVEQRGDLQWVVHLPSVFPQTDPPIDPELDALVFQQGAPASRALQPTWTTSGK